MRTCNGCAPHLCKLVSPLQAVLLPALSCMHRCTHVSADAAEHLAPLLRKAGDAGQLASALGVAAANHLSQAARQLGAHSPRHGPLHAVLVQVRSERRAGRRVCVCVCICVCVRGRYRMYLYVSEGCCGTKAGWSRTLDSGT